MLVKIESITSIVLLRFCFAYYFMNIFEKYFFNGLDLLNISYILETKFLNGMPIIFLRINLKEYIINDNFQFNDNINETIALSISFFSRSNRQTALLFQIYKIDHNIFYSVFCYNMNKENKKNHSSNDQNYWII